MMDIKYEVAYVLFLCLLFDYQMHVKYEVAYVLFLRLLYVLMHLKYEDAYVLFLHPSYVPKQIKYEGAYVVFPRLLFDYLMHLKYQVAYVLFLRLLYVLISMLGCGESTSILFPMVVCVFIISNSWGVRLPGFRSMLSGIPTFPMSCIGLVKVMASIKSLLILSASASLPE